MDCVFPFTHRGVIHHQCAHDTVWRNNYWCPTEYTTYVNTYISPP
jgi:hypothetical protein